MKTELDHDRYRVVWFCDLESRSEFRLATNVDEMTNEQVSEIYRYRWQILVVCPELSSNQPEYYSCALYRVSPTGG